MDNFAELSGRQKLIIGIYADFVFELADNNTHFMCFGRLYSEINNPQLKKSHTDYNIW